MISGSQNKMNKTSNHQTNNSTRCIKNLGVWHLLLFIYILDCLNSLQSRLEDIGHITRADNDDIDFLKDFLKDPVIQKIAQVSN